MRNCSLCISETNCASGTDTHANVRSYILGVPGEIRLSVSPNAPGVCVCVCVCTGSCVKCAVHRARIELALWNAPRANAGSARAAQTCDSRRSKVWVSK